MPELPSVSGKQAIAAFQSLGFSLDRVRGSHHVLKRPGHRYHLTIQVHANRPLPKGTLRSVIRDAGVTVDQFVEALSKL